MSLDLRHSLRTDLWQGVKEGAASLLATFQAPEVPRRGLHFYDIEQPNGRSMRIHLRVEPSGNGVLFVDVTDVVHLNQSATLMAKLALDGVPRYVAQARLAAWFNGAERQQIDRELAHIYNMIDGFRNTSADCPTCQLSDTVEMSPMFSIEVNAPYKVDLALTYGCNNECPHCYNENDRLQMPSLPLQEWYAVLDRLAGLGVPHLILTGGEATLHPDLPKVIEYADRLGMVVGLNTNGRHIAHKPYMDELAAAGLNHVQVTLGSSRAEVHDAMMGATAFEQTVRGIENAAASRVHVITNTTLMRANMEHAEEIIDFIYSLGIRTFAMNGMIYSGGGFAHPAAITEQEMPPLLVRVRDKAQELGIRFLWYTPTEYCRMSPVELEIGAKRCNAGEYSLCIEPNGDVLPCQSYYVSAGNILRDPWEQIWDGELFRSFRYREEDPKGYGLPEKCWTCPDLPLCGGGCRIEREARDGVRVAGEGGGGCSGCSGSCGTGGAADQVKGHGHAVGHVHTAGYIDSGGFIPSPSTTRTTVRSSGNILLIGLEEIQ
ncbi:MAG: radical SAM protein [Anaerolineales bacterium]